MLLAEDNLINQRVAKMMLCSLGMCCEVASNGQEAVDAVQRRIGREDVRQFDVLLMDMAMPVMGGVDATKVCCLLSRFILIDKFQISCAKPISARWNIAIRRCCRPDTWSLRCSSVRKAGSAVQASGRLVLLIAVTVSVYSTGDQRQAHNPFGTCSRERCFVRCGFGPCH